MRCMIYWLICWTTVGWLAGSTTTQADEPSRPNILLIYADDHSAKTLSCYGQAYPLAATPNIDQLAAEGLRFAPSYMGSWCMPSRASLLTGLHPHGIESMRPEGTYPGSMCGIARTIRTTPGATTKTN